MKTPSSHLYLSRLQLNPRNAQVRRECAQAYELHRTLLKAFPADPIHLPRTEDAGCGLLFRLEEDVERVRVLAQSKTPPQWDFLVHQRDGRGYPYLIDSELTGDGLPNPAVTRFTLEDKLAVGSVFLFRLRANPTVKRDRPGRDQGRRVGIYDEVGQIEWMHRKARSAGFEVLDVRTRKLGNMKDERSGVEILAVQFDGSLRVTDPSALSTAVTAGIGPAKGFGFGLLSLATLRSSQ